MESQGTRFEIVFEGMATGTAGVRVKQLQQELFRFSPDVTTVIEKEDSTNQDFGTTLVLVLGTPAVIALAEAVASYLQRNRATIVIKKNGEVLATNISGEDAVKIAEAFQRAGRQ
jgi:hypothetical protein